MRDVRPSYDPRGSGLLNGSGGLPRRGRIKRYPGWSDIMIDDGPRILAEVPDFEEGVRYTPRQLLLMTEKILRSDPKPKHEYPAILFFEHLKERQRREIHAANGTPDPNIVQGIYWRSHPNGRKVNSDEQRKKNGASYYR